MAALSHTRASSVALHDLKPALQYANSIRRSHPKGSQGKKARRTHLPRKAIEACQLQHTCETSFNRLVVEQWQTQSAHSIAKANLVVEVSHFNTDRLLNRRIRTLNSVLCLAGVLQ